MIEIYNSAGTLQCSFPRVLSASLCDKLSGERTLSFSVLASRSQSLSVGMTAKLDGQFYTVVRVAKKITGGFPVTMAQCEHITYLLNEEQYNLVTFVFEGTPADGMTQLLSGTPFSVGVLKRPGAWSARSPTKAHSAAAARSCASLTPAAARWSTMGTRSICAGIAAALFANL